MIIQYQTNTKHIPSTTPKKNISNLYPKCREISSHLVSQHEWRHQGSKQLRIRRQQHLKQTCVTVLATAHATGLVPLRAKPSAGAMKSECGSRVYTDRVVEVVNISQNTGMDLGWINLQCCAKSRLWPPLILSWVFGWWLRPPTIYDETGAAACNIHCYTVIGFW